MDEGLGCGMLGGVGPYGHSTMEMGCLGGSLWMQDWDVGWSGQGCCMDVGPGM